MWERLQVLWVESHQTMRRGQGELLKLAKLAKLVILVLVSMVMCCAVSTASSDSKLLRPFQIVARLVARCCRAQHSATVAW